MILNNPQKDNWMDTSDVPEDGPARAPDSSFWEVQTPPEGVHGAKFGEGTDIGAIHMKISELHLNGRFTNGLPQLEEAFYHNQLAARYRYVVCLYCCITKIKKIYGFLLLLN